MHSFPTVRKYIRDIILTLCCFWILAAPQMVHAVEIAEVTSTSPAWNSFTNLDGTGLYHEILNEVFSLYGLPVRHIYSKSGRSEQLVIKEEADMMTCDDSPMSPLVLARYPMYVNDFYVFFNKERIGEWRGKESLRGKEVLCQPTYYNATNFNVPITIKEVQTGQQALAMILLNRSDFYVDDMALIQESIDATVPPFNQKKYGMEKVGRRSYHPLFNVSERGEKIMQMYNEGVLRLHKSGKLKPIYQKWGYQYPEFDRY